MTDLNPKDLIEIPGAGRAEVACRATGAWDEGRAPDALTWEVEVWAVTTVTQMVKVRARTQEEAGRLAKCQASADADWRLSRHDVEADGPVAWEVRE